MYPNDADRMANSQEHDQTAPLKVSFSLNVSKFRSRNLRYRNDPKFSDTQALANSADPDQTVPRGAV